MKIFLVGFMGSGKTTLGKKIANRLNMEFMDLDEEVEKFENRTIPEIFNQEGEDFFRNAEHTALQRLKSMDGKVVATGGGAPCFRGNMELMNLTGLTIYLKINPGILASRLIDSATERPLIKGMTLEELKAFINLKLSDREPFYNQAKITVEGDNIRASDIVTQIQNIPGLNV